MFALESHACSVKVRQEPSALISIEACANALRMTVIVLVESAYVPLVTKPAVWSSGGGMHLSSQQ